jgi:peptidoglycan/LPS O-acetylase OafA/YrhL
VISGFLITWTTIKRFSSLANINPMAFYLYRLARIGPPLLTTVAILGYLGYTSYPYMDTGNPRFPLSAAILYALTFRENVFLTEFGGGAPQWAVLWSLAIEGAFYLVFPILCLFLRTRALLVAMLALCVIGPMNRLAYAGLPYGYDMLFDYLSCLDGIALGAIVALAANNVGIMAVIDRYHRAIFFTAIGLLFVALVNDNEYVWRPTYVGMAAALVLLPVPLIRKWTWLDLPLRWLGVVSYELYLTHYIILGLMRNAYENHKDALSSHTGLWFLVFVLLALFAASALHFLIARPGRRLVSKLARAIEQLPSRAIRREALPVPPPEALCKDGK